MKQEDVNVVIIPKSCQDTPECDKAKQIGLEKLKHFNTYTEVIDEGQCRISTTWALCEKDHEYVQDLLLGVMRRQQLLKTIHLLFQRVS